MKKWFFVVVWVVLACKPEKKYHDVVREETTAVQSDALQGILDFQKELNEEFKDPDTSPLPDRYRKNFGGLDFFAPDTSYVVRAKLVRTPDALPFLMPTTTDRKSKEVVYGIVHFTLNGEERQLEVYRNEELAQEEEYRDYLFLPFTDETNGKETYTGGRYIDLRIPEGDSITIDLIGPTIPIVPITKSIRARSCPVSMPWAPR